MDDVATKKAKPSFDEGELEDIMEKMIIEEKKEEQVLSQILGSNCNQFIIRGFYKSPELFEQKDINSWIHVQKHFEHGDINGRVWFLVLESLQFQIQKRFFIVLRG